MTTDISREIPKAVIERAQGRRAYCQKPEDREFNPYRHEIDHVIAEKHGGRTELGNLAYACFQCNRYKGTDIASLDPHSGEVTRLFHPRAQKWEEHFALNEDGYIIPRTAEGRITAWLLRFNDPLRVQQRMDLIAVGKLNPNASS